MSNMLNKACNFDQNIDNFDLSNKSASRMLENTPKFTNGKILKLLPKNNLQILKMILSDKDYKDFLVFFEKVKKERVDTINKKFEKSNKNVPEITNQITSYLGGRRKTKKRHLKNKQKKTRRSRK